MNSPSGTVVRDTYAAVARLTASHLSSIVTFSIFPVNANGSLYVKSIGDLAEGNDGRMMCTIAQTPAFVTDRLCAKENFDAAARRGLFYWQIHCVHCSQSVRYKSRRS